MPDDKPTSKVTRPTTESKRQGSVKLANVGRSIPANGFVTFADFTCQQGRAFSAPMEIFQCVRTLVAEPNRLGNRLFLANVTMPLIGQSLTGFQIDRQSVDVRAERRSHCDSR
jgi:hypothetical protein